MQPIVLDGGPGTAQEQAQAFRATPELERCLADLESRIDPEIEETLTDDYRTFLDGHWPEPLFMPRRAAPAPARVAWPEPSTNDALGDFKWPYEQRCLEACGGGIIHFCGRGDHFIASMTRQRGLHGIAMSQPHLNNMEAIYGHTVDRGIPLLGFTHAAARAALAAGRDLRHLVHIRPNPGA